MNAFERKGTFSLAGIYGLRMVGLFMILPVFSLYAEGLQDVTPTLIGLALGIYGLTMAAFQIPFGMMSDRYGRKPVIVVGLLIFAIGSVVAATADSIWGVIVGRALQGAGAIAAAMMALLADLTREDHRTKAMGIMGVSIGMSFMLALILGPFLDNIIGVQGIFWLTAVLAILAIGVLYLIVPNPVEVHSHRDVQTVPAKLKQVLGDKQLLRLDIGILIQHAVMMAMFTALPFVLRDYLHLPSSEHAWFYLPVLVLAIFGMVPMIIIAEKRRKMKEVFIFSIILMAASELALGFMHTSWWAVAIGLFVFFVAFNVLEATLPSLISRMAPVDGKGTAMGVYSTSQFFGAFLGGAGGGWIYGHLGLEGVFFACVAIIAIWFLFSLGMKMPAYLNLVMLRVQPHHQQEDIGAKLLALAGVHEAQFVLEDEVVYLRVDKATFDMEQAEAIVK
ncbi:MAG: MFS transporter [Zetaproteobacteria bacterium]|nr:MFS transporter [Zetaproteobacteria bacterium]